MASSVRFISITPSGPVDPCALEPAPSVTDWAYITDVLVGVPPIPTVDALLEGTHKILCDYRSWSMWLYPNVRFYRDEPKTEGGQGMARVALDGHGGEGDHARRWGEVRRRH